MPGQPLTAQVFFFAGASGLPCLSKHYNENWDRGPSCSLSTACWWSGSSRLWWFDARLDGFSLTFWFDVFHLEKTINFADFLGKKSWKNTLPETNIAPETPGIWRWISSLKGLLAGAMLIFGGCNECNARWWFQIFFIFTSYLGKIQILTHIFQMGLKPPTSNVFIFGM